MSAAEQPPAPPLRGLLRALATGVSLAAALAATVAGVIALPDGNDYALATRLKHDHLASLAGPKVVFVGGSNLAFGLESEMVERGLSRPVVNMGMNGYLGVRFMLEEVKAELRHGDVVVLSLEYDSFFKPVEGTPADLLMIVKSRPSNVGSLNWQQRLGVLGVAPYAAQQKIIRLIGEGIEGARVRALALAGRQDESGALTAEEESLRRITSVESLAGFDGHGDLNSHVGIEWPFDREDGVDASATPVDDGVIGLLVDFATSLQRDEVVVVLSYTPAVTEYYERHRAGIQALHERLCATGALTVPSAPKAFVFADDLFFDTVYHLNERGREIRTTRVVSDLLRVLGGRAGSCRTDALERHP